MATIRCTVSNCEYWGEGNNCRADSILVMAPGSRMMQADHHGRNAESLEETPANSDKDTLCFTFEKEEKEQGRGTGMRM